VLSKGQLKVKQALESWGSKWAIP